MPDLNIIQIKQYVILLLINTEKLSLISTNFKILYKFGSIEQEENYIILNSENDIYPDGLNISAKIMDINTETILASLVLEEEYLIWENPPIIQDNKKFMIKAKKELLLNYLAGHLMILRKNVIY